MNIRFVTGSLMRSIERVSADCEITCAARLECDSGGERYLFECGANLLLVERVCGSQDYLLEHFSPGSVRIIERERQKVLLETESGRIELSVSWSEANDFNTIFDHLAEHGIVELDAITPKVLLAAGLLFAAGADQNLEGAEEAYCTKLFDPAHLRKAWDYYENHALPEYAKCVREKFSPAQKRALLVRMTELTMADGVWTRAEQSFLRDFAVSIGIEKQSVDHYLEFAVALAQQEELFG